FASPAGGQFASPGRGQLKSSAGGQLRRFLHPTGKVVKKLGCLSSCSIPISKRLRQERGKKSKDPSSRFTSFSGHDRRMSGQALRHKIPKCLFLYAYVQLHKTVEKLGR